MEGDEEDLLLLLDHDGEFSLFSLHELGHLLIAISALSRLQIFRLLFEFANSHNVALNLMVNDSHCSVSDLVVGEELVELSEVGVRLEYVQEIQGQVDRLLVIVT